MPVSSTSAPGANLQSELIRALTELLHRPQGEVSLHERFRDQGLDSVGAQALSARLSRLIGRPVPATAVWQHPTPARLLAHLQAAPASADVVAPTTSAARAEEPIAIVGIGCRLPGGVRGPEALLRALLDGLDGICEVPRDRWAAADWLDPDPKTPGTMSTRWGGFLDDVARFDAPFFGISPREATQMDPQQRLALETTWEALEDAGLLPGALSGSRAGVFLGAMSGEYDNLADGDARAMTEHSAVGWDTSIISGRIAYRLGTHGPALTVNTACSSSLVAVHLAVQSLRSGESSLALAGGVSLMVSPHATVRMTKFGAMNPAGQCRAFDAGAGGYVRGEGCGVVVLRPLSQALARGERVYALLRGSALNNDGPSNGLTAPNPEAQSDVIRSAWAEANVPTTEVSYVEAHGPGTILGDPLEAGALGAVFAPGRAEPLIVGSIKTNLGHLEAAAGVTGLIKTALALHHGVIPRNLHFDAPNPHIDFDALKLSVPTATRPWPRGATRFAGVSSFGFSGTNAHAALSEAPGRAGVVVGLRGHTPEQLVEQAEGLSSALRALSSDAELRALGGLRGEGPWRAAVHGQDARELLERLEQLRAGTTPPTRAEAPRVLFFFSGQGGQWPGMAQDLLAREPAFRQVLDEIDATLAEEAGWSVIEALSRPAEQGFGDEASVVQTLMFSVQVGLARLLETWGVRPDAVFGQSVGEIAGAVIAGALSLQDGVRLIVRRSRLTRARASGRGGMAVIELGPREADELLADGAAGVDVGVYLSTDQVVLSGEQGALDALLARLEQVGVPAQRVRMDYASHSREMDPLLPELQAALAGITPRAPELPFWSTARDGWIRGAELGPAYWAQNLRQPVHLVQAIDRLSAEGPALVVELGPHPTALRAIVTSQRALGQGDSRALATCWRGEPARRGLEALVSELWQAGVPVDLAAVAHGGRPPAPAPLPLVLSASSEPSLRAQAGRWAAWLGEHPEVPWADVIRTAALHREPLRERAAIIARSHEEAQEALVALHAGASHPRLRVGVGRGRRGLVFVFPGHGSQWEGMGRALLAENQPFAAAIAACDRALRPHLGWSVEGLLRAGEGPAFDRVDVLQPVLFAVGIALAAACEASGLRPDAVVGHSVGELAAAVVAGILTLEEGAALVALRGRLIAEAPGPGGMLAVSLSVKALGPQLLPWAGKLSLAVVNGPEATVVSGEPAALSALRARLEERGARCRPVDIGFAAHSPQMDPLLSRLDAAVRPQKGRIPLYSAVTGGRLEGVQLDGGYWRRNLRDVVRFDLAAKALLADGFEVFLELGGHPALSPHLALAGEAQGALTVGALRRGGGSEELSRALGQLFVEGGPVDWRGALRGAGGALAALPTYAFEGRRYWLTPTPVAAEARPANRHADWLYAETWRATSHSEVTASASGPWWIVAEGAEALADTLRTELEARGCRALRLGLSEALGRLTRGEVEAGLSVCWCAGPADLSAGGLLGLGKAAAALSGAAPRLFALTSGAGSPLALVPWGLGRALALEIPRVWGGLVELPAAPSAADLRALADQLLSPRGEAEVRVQGGLRLVRRLTRVAPPPAARAWSPAGTVLITGGAGALGQRLCGWLIERGARHVVLASRGLGALDPGARWPGKNVEHVSCDLSDGDAVRRLVEGLPELKAVFHCAGLIDDTPLVELSPERLGEVLAAKALGAVALHEACAARALDKLVLYGSISGLWGAGGQSAYAAANAGLQSLAHHRRALGLPATVLHWGPWAEGGMADGSRGAQLARRGLRPMDPARALAALGLALDAGLDELAVVDVDWAVFAPLFQTGASGALLDLIPEVARRREDEARASTAVAEWPRALAALPAAARPARLLELVRGETAAALGYTSAAELPAEGGFAALGMDSVIAVEMRQRVQRRVGLELPATVTFDHPTPAALASWLATQLGLSAEAQEAPAARTTGSGALAIVGVGLRLPGGAEDLDGLWRVLSSGEELQRPVPAERMALAYDPDRQAKGRSYTRTATLLDDVAGFDAGLFGISPREALPMDPQHRLLLEAGWSALEDGGFPAERLKGTATGVFVGLGPNEYEQHRGRPVSEADAYSLTGSFSSFAAGRLAYHLGLQGPALVVDTACSSSLVAIQLAAESLRAGRCALALAGGAQVLASPDTFVGLSRTQALAPDGVCKPFSASADGYGRGEGVGLLLLMRLEDALAQGRRIHGVLRGAAVVHDGESSGITTPNGSAQQRVVRAALADAGLRPADVDVVECHGTGTALGDPIEVQALAAAYGEGRAPAQPLRIGSVKGDIGHLESAAGVAGVLKVLACLRRGVLAASRHADPPNPHIAWESLPLEVARAPLPWARAEGRPRRAGVSAFGLSGTNAHLILEEPPSAHDEGAAPELPNTLPLFLSGHSEAALRGQARRLAEWMEARPELGWTSIRRTAALGRSQLRHRACVTAQGPEEAARALRALAEDRPHPAHQTGVVRAPGPLAWLFPGHGSQWEGMGRALLDESPAFARAVRSCDEALHPHLGYSVEVALRGADGPPMARVDVAQACMFAMSVGLAAVWRELGVVPSAVVGHSAGESAAAVVAGALSLEDGARLVATRGQLIAAIARKGGMLYVQLPAEAAAERAAPWGEALTVGVINAPGASVLSGDEAALLEAKARFEAEGLFCRRVNIAFAAHSPHMDEVLPAMRVALAELRPRAGELPFYSSVTGERVDGSTLDADYWCRNVRDLVRFDRVCAALVQDGHRSFVELGGHPVLTLPVQAACEPQGGVVLGSLQRGQGGVASLHRALGALHAQGVPVDLEACFGRGPVEPDAAPTFAFQRTRYWLPPRPTPRPAVVAQGWPLAGQRHPLPSGGALHVVSVGPGIQRYLADHRVYGHIVVPGAFHVSVLLSVAAHQWPGEAVALEEVQFVQALLFEGEDDAVELMVQLQAQEDGALAATVATLRGDRWTTHATARLLAAPADAPPSLPVPAHPSPLPPEALLDTLEAIQVSWGPRWRWLRTADRQDDRLVLGLTSPEGAPSDDAPVAGGLLDNTFAALLISVDGVLSGADPSASKGTPALPFALDRLLWRGSAEPARWASLERVRREEAGASADLVLYDEHGRCVATLEGFTTRSAPAERFLAGRHDRERLYRLDWRPLSAIGSPAGQGIVLGRGARLAEALGWPRVSALEELLKPGGAAPSRIVVDFSELPPAEEPLSATHETTAEALRVLQALRQAPGLNPSPVVFVTRGAVAAGPHDDVDQLAAAPLWGLLRAARAEDPGRPLRVLDLDDSPRSPEALAGLLGMDHEPELAWRSGVALAPRVEADGPRRDTLATPPAGGDWHITGLGTGSPDGLRVEATQAARGPLAPGEVRLSVGAVGLNFLDVVRVLGMVQVERHPLLLEAAGEVLEVGAGVDGLRPGDRVMGLTRTPGGTVAVANADMVAVIPNNLPLAQAATLPVAFLTALFSLRELAGLQAGERVLIHAGAGGTGMAAVQIARWLGAEIFATASPSKWPVLRALGLDDRHIASSRDANFLGTFLGETGGAGMHVVLNCLAGPLTDASLDLLPHGGRFVEIGKTDIRDPERVAASHPGVTYQAFDLLKAEPARVGAHLRELAELLERGALTPLPLRTYDLRQAPAAFRQMAAARHVGKLVLRAPDTLDPRGTVLITGGLGALGRALARHLVVTHGVRHLALLSRHGAEGADERVAELRALGAESVVTPACDVGSAEALAEVLRGIPAERPLTGVFHLAGVLDDSVLDSLTPARLSRVLRPKVDGAWNLHRLTEGQELGAFVLFSSISGRLGGAGQGSYAAANAFLDALAAHRRRRGLAGQSLAWGLWDQQGMSATLGQSDLTRLHREGIEAMSVEGGMGLLDLALAHPEALLLPARLRVSSPAPRPPPRVEPPEPPPQQGPPTDGEARQRWLARLVRQETAAVLCLAGLETVPEDQPLLALGLDSLMAVELRNRLRARGLSVSVNTLLSGMDVRTLAQALVAEGG